jgi:hypothetical protein
MAEGRALQLPHRSQRLAEANATLVKVALLIHQGNEGGRRAYQFGSQAGHPVEHLFGHRIQQIRFSKRGKTGGIAGYGGKPNSCVTRGNIPVAC